MKLLNNLLIFSSSLFFLAVFLPSGHMPSDTKYSLATAQSICRGKLSITPDENLPYLSKGTHGKFYSKYGLGYALIFVPSGNYEWIGYIYNISSPTIYIFSFVYFVLFIFKQRLFNSNFEKKLYFNKIKTSRNYTT